MPMACLCCSQDSRSVDGVRTAGLFLSSSSLAVQLGGRQGFVLSMAYLCCGVEGRSVGIFSLISLYGMEECKSVFLLLCCAVWIWFDLCVS